MDVLSFLSAFFGSSFFHFTANFLPLFGLIAFSRLEFARRFFFRRRPNDAAVIETGASISAQSGIDARPRPTEKRPRRVRRPSLVGLALPANQTIGVLRLEFLNAAHSPRLLCVVVAKAQVGRVHRLVPERVVDPDEAVTAMNRMRSAAIKQNHLV